MADFDFDLNDESLDDNRAQGAVPAGVYRMMCIEANDKAARTGGMMIAARFKVVEGEYKGSSIWHNFNVENRSAEAQRIGRSQIKRWREACGKPNATGTDALMEVPFYAMVTVESTAQYGERNRLSYFVVEKKPGAEPPPRAEQPKAAPKSPGKQKNPWE